jgi:hypothetical protein
MTAHLQPGVEEKYASSDRNILKGNQFPTQCLEFWQSHFSIGGAEEMASHSQMSKEQCNHELMSNFSFKLNLFLVILWPVYVCLEQTEQHIKQRR